MTALEEGGISITGGASTIVTSNLTANRALISNSSGKVAVSAVTSTELSYLDGVTSNVQTQLNAKATTSTVTSLTSRVSTAESDISSLETALDGKAESPTYTSMGSMTVGYWGATCYAQNSDNELSSITSYSDYSALADGTIVSICSHIGSSSASSDCVGVGVKKGSYITGFFVATFVLGASEQNVGRSLYFLNRIRVGTGSTIGTADSTNGIGILW